MNSQVGILDDRILTTVAPLPTRGPTFGVMDVYALLLSSIPPVSSCSGHYYLKKILYYNQNFLLTKGAVDLTGHIEGGHELKQSMRNTFLL